MKLFRTGNTKNNLSLFSDEMIILKMSEGERQAMNIFYERHADAFYRYIFRFVYPDMAKAEDLLQDLFVRIWEKSYLFNREQRAMPWCYAIAANICRSNLKFDNKTKIDHTENISKLTVLTEQKNNYDIKRINYWISEALLKLSTEERELIHFRFDLEFSIQEISDILQIAEGTVKSRLFYIIKKIRTHLPDEVYNH